MASILLDHFYKIDSLIKEEAGIRARVTFEVDHPIFKGHFPDMPIVPGVCQTQMLSEVLSQALGSDMQLQSAASVKFLSVVDPMRNPTLDLVITYTRSEHSYNVSAQYKWDETTFFKFKGIFVVAA